MDEHVKIPKVGGSIEAVTISSWRKKQGEHVAMNETVAELKSDKKTFELTAPQSGTLNIVKQEGETVPVGEVVCKIDTSAGRDPAAKKSLSTDAASSTGEVKEMRVPEVGESITEVTLSGWLKKDGDRVALDETIAELESDKATFELPAEGQGVLKIIAREGETLPIGALLCSITLTEDAPPKATTPSLGTTAEPSSKADSASSYAAGHPSPAAGKILDEKGMLSTHVVGTGIAGRITKKDAMRLPSAPPKVTTANPPTLEKNRERGERREKLSSLRRTIARRLLSAKHETAMLTTFNEVNMKGIMGLRSRYKEIFKKKYDVGLGFMSFFTKAVCSALKSFPSVNAYLDGENIVYHDYCDISIAVSTPKGLVVPVIRNADLLTMHEIEKEVLRLATRGRDGKLSIEEMTGGTFSITNGGVFGSMLSTPILNPPQPAILGMHNIVQRPMAVNGEVVILPMMYVALSYDHRIIDGKESVSFLVRVKEMLEDPNRLILDV